MMHSKSYHFTLFIACFSLAFSLISSLYSLMPNMLPGHHSSLQLFLIIGTISLFLAAQLHLDVCLIYLMLFALVEENDEEDEDLDDEDDTEEEPDQLEAVTESETQKGN